VTNANSPPEEPHLAATRAWVDEAVIGLNLCPFAKAPQVKGLVRYVLSQASDPAALRNDLIAELRRLHETDAEQVETTLLVHPHTLKDFEQYNDFLDVADAAVDGLGLEGVLQVASFHPDYRFAGTTDDDLGNATNRSPFPTLHLLREESIDRAVTAFPEAGAIYEQNMATMAALGPQAWQAIQRRCLAAGTAGEPASPGA